jgi:hypothetical protein
LDGLYVGCLFCELEAGGEGEAPSGNFFYLHKIEIILLEPLEHSSHLRIRHNTTPLLNKKLHLRNRNKSLFPNLKIPVRMSDVLVVEFEHGSVSIRDVRFVMDSVKRGKTSTFEAWLRNPLKNKVGDIKIEYFLENMYLDN